jgi:hypothetical protein
MVAEHVASLPSAPPLPPHMLPQAAWDDQMVSPITQYALPATPPQYMSQQPHYVPQPSDVLAWTHKLWGRPPLFVDLISDDEEDGGFKQGSRFYF